MIVWYSMIRSFCIFTVLRPFRYSIAEVPNIWLYSPTEDYSPIKRIDIFVNAKLVWYFVQSDPRFELKFIDIVG